MPVQLPCASVPVSFLHYSALYSYVIELMFFRRAGSPYGRPAGIYRLAARLNVPAGRTEIVGEGVGIVFLGDECVILCLC